MRAEWHEDIRPGDWYMKLGGNITAEVKRTADGAFVPCVCGVPMPFYFRTADAAKVKASVLMREALTRALEKLTSGDAQTGQ